MSWIAETTSFAGKYASFRCFIFASWWAVRTTLNEMLVLTAFFCKKNINIAGTRTKVHSKIKKPPRVALGW
jgi:hypothetical protein